MRIAILGSKGVPGRHGVEVVVDNIASRLVTQGHDVSIFGYSTYFGKMQEYKGCKLVPIEGNSNKFLEMPTHAIKTRKVILSEYQDKFDVVHIHSTDPCLFLKAVKKKVPVVATSHGRAYLRNEVDPIRKLLSKTAEKAFLKAGHASTGVSPVDVDYYNSLGIASAGRVKYIPNGLPSIPMDIPLPESLGLTSGKYILFSAGRIIPSKGLHVLQEAMAKTETDLPLAIVGGKGFDEDYYKQVKNTFPNRCKWLGFLRDNELYGVYKHAKIAVFPSLYEAQSMTLLEFLALGVNIVYSDLPENQAITGSIGLPFKSANPDSLHQALMHALNGDCPNDSTARNRIVQHHNWEKITEQYIEAYNQAILLSRKYLNY
ncbi:MAG: glycosyltransferase family 4 protein [Candidatus Sabulitectum sp.]|nr:glycosyltransferase family 4 protein [Candidatus Sabulitectum sp.]